MLINIILIIVVCIGVAKAGLEQIRGQQSKLEPGGRYDVHGWLILPQDQPKNPSNTTAPYVKAWFSHHVPEFWTNSPHNYQIILEGIMTPETSLPGQPALPFNFPQPPMNDLVQYQYSFTPPPPFSLNDLLNGDIRQFRGVYYNGSFHSEYERIPQSVAILDILSMPTAVYLSEFETNSFPNLRYLSYPRGDRDSVHFYFLHEIHAQPDFDHIIHGTLTECASKEDIHGPGMLPFLTP